jgi:phenylalanyl-tRNA synthetase beta chain
MKISYNWLKEYLPVELEPEKVSELLTDTGLEVEGLERIDTVKGGLKGVVIGEVISCKPHPNADKLKLTEVNIGLNEPLQIVCGAPNVDKGQFVPVATINTEIHTEEGSFKIKKSKLRGELSEGMICSAKELGLGDSHEGIMVLDEPVAPGTQAAEYFEIESDHVFEIGLTPNRTDAMSHYGVARDLRAALLRHGTSALELNAPSVSSFSVQNKSLLINIKIENSEACYRYTGLSISGVKVESSPSWLQNRLRSIGLSPINNVVDITNYVLHETGHPLHAFDADQIKGGQIIVKNLPEGSPFTTLDGTEIKLSNKDLMICDEERGLVLAGVYGGSDSGVSEKTSRVFLEGAYFNPVSVRKSAKRHGLSTDSSFRYERGVDPEMTLYALKRAAILIRDIAGGEISMDIADEHPVKLEKPTLSFNLERMNRLIGQEIPVEVVRNILSSLDIKIRAEHGGNMQLEIPLYRTDVRREADVVEEVLRIYGFNAIDEPKAMRISIAQGDAKGEPVYRKLISNFLSSIGFFEIMNNSLTKGTYFEKAGFKPEYSIAMLNPLSQDLGVMRQSLVFGGLENLAYNIKRQRPQLKFYEFGRQYRLVGDQNYHEEMRLALWLTGGGDSENWREAQRESDFYDLKASCLNILKRLGLPKLKEKANSSPLFSEGLELTKGKKLIATLGKVKPEIARDLDIKQAVYYAEIAWPEALDLARKNQIIMQELPRFPEVRRDLALLVDKSTEYRNLEATALQNGGNLLKEVNLFDVYEGKNLPANKKSYAMSFILQHDAKTLNDQMVEQTMARILKALEKEHQVSLR